MKNVQLVYAELTNGITLDVLGDKEVVIISDGAVFMVTTEENSKKYDEEFYFVDAEAIVVYELEQKFGSNSRIIPIFQEIN